jgi:hypothetical protein
MNDLNISRLQQLCTVLVVLCSQTWCLTAAQAQIVFSWAQRQDLTNGMPPGIAIYETSGRLPSNRPVRAYYAELLPPERAPQLELRVVASEGLATTGSIAARHNALVAINAGFFAAPSPSVPSGSVSLIITDSLLITRNIASLARPGENNVNTTFYPTRCAFGIVATPTGGGQLSGGQSSGVRPEVTWTYTTGTSPTSPTYSYPAPSPNRTGTAPQPQPTADFPPGARLWQPVMAIGGLPMLVHEGRKRLTTDEELTPADIPPANPRTAIGYRADGTTILLVVDGRQEASMGADVNELAEMMLGLGCVGAINLDGGGSTTMVARVAANPAIQPPQPTYRLVNTPIDRGIPGTQRAVGSVVLVRSRPMQTSVQTSASSANNSQALAQSQAFSQSSWASSHPNPASTSTTLTFGLPAPSRASLVICDALGRVVETLLNDAFVQAGECSLEWRIPQTLAPGIYTAVFRTQQVLVKKHLVVVR